MISQIASTLFTEELYDIKKKTVVITSDPWEKISELDRVLLQKILQAVGLSIDAVQLVHQPVLSIEAIRANAVRVIYFGPGVKGLPQFEATQIDDVPVILSPPLGELQSDSAVKQKLWTALKLLFGR